MCAQPVVSVIAVSYNHSRWILEALESVRAQTWPFLDVVYVDDASSDGSSRIASDWIRENRLPWRSICHEHNRGLCPSLNEALRTCQGDYVQLLSCDDVLRPAKFTRQVAVLEQCGPEVALACSNFCEIDPVGNVLTEQYRPESFQLPQDLFVGVLTTPLLICAPTMLIRRSVLQAIGEFDERFLAEDVSMLLRMFCEHSAAYVPDVLVDYRRVESSLSRDPARQKKLAMQRLEAIESIACSGARRAAVDRQRGVEALRVAAFCVHEGNWEEAESWIARYAAFVNGTGRAFLTEAFARHPGYSRRLMAKYRLSTQSPLRDWSYRFGSPRIVHWFDRLRAESRGARPKRTD